MRWAFLLSFGLIGLGTLVGGIASSVGNIAFMVSSHRTTGKIVDFDQESKSSSSKNNRNVTYFYPVAEYYDLNDRKLRVTGRTGNAERPDYNMMEPVPVYFDPEVPDRAIIADFRQAWAGNLALFIFGAVFSFLAILSFRIMTNFKKNRPKRPQDGGTDTGSPLVS